MITYVKGDLFESPAKVLVNTVNTVGVMGKGIAKTFKGIYPEMFTQYQRLCEEKRFDVGQLWLYKTPHKWILNFPTKKHWRQPSRPEYIEAGLRAFIAGYASHGITSIAFPRLGCGNGELDWEMVVQPLMIRYLDKLPIDVFVYHHGHDPFMPEHRDIASMRTWLRSEPQALAFEEVWDDLVSLIGTGRELTTLDGSERFTIEYINRPAPEEWLKFETQREFRGIPKDALLDLWQNIRSYGFCLARIMPQGLDLFAPYIVSLLSLLPYLKPVEVFIRNGEILVQEIGLRLRPQAAQAASPSFEVSPV